MRTPLELLTPHRNFAEMCNIIQALYLLEKIDKSGLRSCQDQYIDVAHKTFEPGLLLLLRYGVYVRHISPYSTQHVAAQDGGSYLSRLWSVAGYDAEHINWKLLQSYPRMQQRAQAIVSHAKAHSAQWQEETRLPEVADLAAMLPGRIALVQLEDANGAWQAIVFGREGEEYLFFDPEQGGYGWSAEEFGPQLQHVQILSTTPF